MPLPCSRGVFYAQGKPMRLTKSIRAQILINVINASPIQDEIKALKKEIDTAILTAVFDTTTEFGKKAEAFKTWKTKFDALVASAPEDTKSNGSNLYGHNKIPNYSFKGLSSEALIYDYRHETHTSKTLVWCARFIWLDSPVIAALPKSVANAIDDKVEAMNARFVELIGATQTALEAFTTTKRLREEWPEIEAFVPLDSNTSSKALTVPLHALNKKLNLPPEVSHAS